jgi:hypothetical protein
MGVVYHNRSYKKCESNINRNNSFLFRIIFCIIIKIIY